MREKAMRLVTTLVTVSFSLLLLLLLPCFSCVPVGDRTQKHLNASSRRTLENKKNFFKAFVVCVFVCGRKRADREQQWYRSPLPGWWQKTTHTTYFLTILDRRYYE